MMPSGLTPLIAEKPKRWIEHLYLAYFAFVAPNR